MSDLNKKIEWVRPNKSQFISGFLHGQWWKHDGMMLYNMMHDGNWCGKLLVDCGVVCFVSMILNHLLRGSVDILAYTYIYIYTPNSYCAHVLPQT